MIMKIYDEAVAPIVTIDKILYIAKIIITVFKPFLIPLEYFNLKEIDKIKIKKLKTKLNNIIDIVMQYNTDDHISIIFHK